MILYKPPAALHQKVQSLKNKGKSIGFVPTMGALHKGHLSLIEASRQQNDITICSIFVNPTQFNDPADFSKYPVTIEADIQKLTEGGCDILFLPSVEEMYPTGLPAKDHYHLGELETVLEGKYRPGHFQGVCQVLRRLFNMVQPHRAYFGQKDYQQCMVVKKLVKGQNMEIEIVIEPTMRELSGLAMSSRNLRLSDDDTASATAIYKALTFIKENQSSHSPEQLTATAADMLLQNGFESVDYIEIVNADTLQAVVNFHSERKVALVAAFLGGIRLIDNLLL